MNTNTTNVNVMNGHNPVVNEGLAKSSARNFYAVKENARGEVIPYAFEKIADRNVWINKRGARPSTAHEVYAMIHRQHGEVVIANRNHRLKVVHSADDVILDKGHRVIFV